MTTPTGRRSATRILCTLLFMLGALAGVVAWMLPATSGSGGTDDAPQVSGVIHSMFPIIGFAICAGCAWRVGAGWSPGGGGTLRLLLYALGLAVVLQALRLSPFVPATFMLVLNLSLALAGSLLLLRADRWLPPIARRSLDVLLGVTLLLLVGAETGLRLIAWQTPRADMVQRDEPPASRLEKLRRHAGQPRFGIPLGSGGHLSPAPRPADADSSARPRPPRPQVVLLGDESLWGHVPAPRSPGHVAAALSPATDFIDRGVPGSGPREQLVLLERELAGEPRPTAVILTLDVTDDLGDVGRDLGPWRSLAMLVDREDLLLTVLLDAMLQRRADGPSPAPADQLPWPAEVDTGSATESLPAPAEQDETALDDAELARRLPWLDDPGLEREVLPRTALERRLAGRIRDAFGTGAAGRLDRLVATVDAMADACAAGGVAFGVLILPARDQIDRDLGAWTDSIRPIDAPAASVQKLLEERLRAHGITLRDALPALRAARPWRDGQPHLFHAGSTELNSRGCRIVGGLLQTFANDLIGGHAGPASPTSGDAK